MDTKELLAKASPRPWVASKIGCAALQSTDHIFGANVIVNCGGWGDTRRDNVNDIQEANAELVRLAVNTFEEREALVEKLVEALESIQFSTNNSHVYVLATVALALARGEQPKMERTK